jgi:hypothetical protein
MANSTTDPVEPGARLDTEASPQPRLDVEALRLWLDTQDLPGRGAPIEHRHVSGGSQNEIF